MSIGVISTRRAQKQADDLDRRHALVFNAFVDDLARNGCAALGYRLTGPVPISRMCVRHLRGALRVVVAYDLADLIIRTAKQRRTRRQLARPR